MSWQLDIEFELKTELRLWLGSAGKICSHRVAQTSYHWNMGSSGNPKSASSPDPVIGSPENPKAELARSRVLRTYCFQSADLLLSGKSSGRHFRRYSFVMAGP